MIDVELKSILDDLMSGFKKILDVGLLTDDVYTNLRKEYDKGLDLAETQFNMNFVRDYKRLDVLQKYTFDNIKGMNEDIAQKLKQVISRGILNLDSINTIQKGVQKVMDIGIDRARMIARTETVRALNM